MQLTLAISLLIRVVSAGALLGALFLARRKYQRADRRSPLTRGLLRGPGHSLQHQLEDVRWDLGALYAALPSVPLVLYALYLEQRLGARPPGLPTAVFYVAIAVAAIGWGAVQMARKLGEIRKIRLGLDAERAAAEELNRLMHEGFWVFHDVPGDKTFNIDHVVVGPTGVYAVETKGRPKRTTEANPNGYKVQYDGKSLAFPGWREGDPLKQAEITAEWLCKWLSSAVGEPVAVQPVLVLPGWFINRTSSEGIPVLNGKEAKSYFTRRRGPELPSKLIQQIVHQLDQRCRDIEPQGYRQAGH